MYIPGELNPDVNQTPPNPQDLQPGGKKEYGRKTTANDRQRAQKSLNDQRRSAEATSRIHNLASTEDDWMPEPAGLGGNLWWTGGGSNGLEEPEEGCKTRPVLTKIMRGIVAGKIKCVVVWNLDRLWRDVSICKEMLNVLYKYKCLLYDASGAVNLWTYEGRNSILQNAIAAQAVREAAAISSPRGVRENKEDGKLVVSPNVQGFRTGGPRSCEVLHIPEEQELVIRIHYMFDEGASPEKIAQALMAEGRNLYEHSGGDNPHGRKRVEGNQQVVYTGAISDILKDCRYIGKQAHVPKRARDDAKRRGVRLDPREFQTPCPAFLRGDGTTVVPIDLWDRNQAKMDARRRTSNRSVNKRPLASLVRCGIDGEPLTAQDGHWIMRKKRPGCKCADKLPCVRETALHDYVVDTLCSLMLVEIGERFDNSAYDEQCARQAALEKELKEATDWHSMGLANWAGKAKPRGTVFQQMQENAEADVERLRQELAMMAVDENSTLRSAQTLTDIKNAPEGALRDALRQCIVWIAVFSTPSERQPKASYTDTTSMTTTKYTYAPSIVGKLVTLTSWGTYHTAVIFRPRDGIRKGSAPYALRPATVEETIGGVADFPRPDKFISGLADDWKGRVYSWSPDRIAPGYCADSELPIVHFSLTESTKFGTTDKEELGQTA